jgi:hypothetical protein
VWDLRQCFFIGVNFVIVHLKQQFLFSFSFNIVVSFRLYALRRIRDGFRAGKSLTDPAEIMEAVQKGEDNLEVIKRQVRFCALITNDLVEHLSAVC